MVHIWVLRGILCPARGPLCASLSFPLCGFEPPCPSLFPLFRETTRLHLGSPFLCCVLEILSMPKSGAVLGLSSFMSYLSGITALHCLMSIVLRTIFIYFVWLFSCFGWENKSRFCFSSRAMVEVSRFTDLFNVVILDLQHHLLKVCFGTEFDCLNSYFKKCIWLHYMLVEALGIFSWGIWTLSYMWALVPWPGMEPRPPALGAQSLSHWTTREALLKFILCLTVSSF